MSGMSAGRSAMRMGPAELVQAAAMARRFYLEGKSKIQIAEEFGFRIRAFHHALEAYKVRDVIVAHGAGIATWADWWGFKIEAFDGIPENAALFFEQGGRPIIHSDSPVSGQRLNQDAAKAMAAGRAAGIAVSDA